MLDKKQTRNQLIRLLVSAPKPDAAAAAEILGVNKEHLDEYTRLYGVFLCHHCNNAWMSDTPKDSDGPLCKTCIKLKKAIRSFERSFDVNSDKQR